MVSCPRALFKKSLSFQLVLREDVEDRREGQKDQAKRILGNMKSNSRFASSQVLCPW